MIGLVFSVLLFVVVFTVVVALALGGTVPDAFAGFGLVVLLAGLVSTGTYIIGLSAVGGWVGNYLKYDTDIGG